MTDLKTLKGKTIFMSGGSRGIGLAIALRAARDGANIAIAAKTAEPHPKLPGTIYMAAKEIEAAGGQALPLICDVRDEDNVQSVIEQTIEKFGGIDICVNNASAISLTGTEATSMKRYDLMNQVNARGTFLLSKLCLPHLKKSDHAHILNLSPPLDMSPKWFKNHTAYTMAKYGMSMCTLGMAEEFKPFGIGVNSVWPLTAIDTAAVRNVLGGDQMAKMSRTPDILSDCAHMILIKDPKEFTGNFVVDEQFMRAEGITDFTKYSPGYDGPLAG
ncbi:MAG: NAD(P)-dependent oxidoreductase, partial [Robiginitomaculum sp.]|nr:NAD(P)-dependent oxidoreductase [Robiginitomaculum sp.]